MTDPARARSSIRLLRSAALVVVPLLAQGCAAALGAGSIAISDKTPVDHVYSLVTGKDCSFVRERHGLSYCVEDEVVAPVRVQCYPTLGEPTCYNVPEPFPGNQRRLGSDVGGAAVSARSGS